MASSEEFFTDRRPASDGNGGKTQFTDDIDVLDVVDFPCLVDEETMEFLRSHGRVFFLSRGPPGSGKGTVASRLHELYPDSRLYWSDKMFLSPAAPARTKETLAESHAFCRQKIAEYMKKNVPVVINRNTNMMVWEVSPFLQIAATYGYTVIILDINRNLILDPQVLAITNSKGLDQRYMSNRMKQWEHVYPFATGWSPRPRDAALLLRRYKELAADLANGSNNHVDLKPVQNTQVFPFCLARVCWFCWDEGNRNYWHSEQVKKAYGSKDTISIFGYAVLGDLVTAMVDLTDVQLALTGDGERAADWNSAKNSSKDEHLPNAACSRLSAVMEFDEMQCTLDLDALAAPDVNEEELEETSAYRELPPPSRVSFIILGSTSSEPITYSQAVRSCFSSLCNGLLSWTKSPDAQSRMDVGGVAVYGAGSENGCPVFILDEKTVKMDVVFTGYYQSHTTRTSARCSTWSTGHEGVACGRRPFWGGPQRGAAATRYTKTPRAAMGYRGGTFPMDNTQLLERMDAPCLKDEKTQRFLRTHGRLLFLVRGPASLGKDTVAAELEHLYPESRAYWSDKLFSSPMAPGRNTASIRESHDLCLSKVEGFMKIDTSVIINKNPNVMVWEVANFLVLASRYGYTVIIIDMPHHFSSDPKVLGATNMGLGEPHLAGRVKQWEEVHPFATGWSPRPKDAARLLQRFRQLRTALLEKDPNVAPQDVSTSHIYPFCLAKLCLFGRTTTDSDYCRSEKVRKAFGQSDTLRVFGYAVVRGFVFALVDLSLEQASLSKADSVDDCGSLVETVDDMDALSHRFEVSLSPQDWEEVSCIIDLAKFLPKGDGNDQDNILHSVGDKISLKDGQHHISPPLALLLLQDVDPSRVTFMPLGSVEGTKYSCSGAAGAPWKLLSSMLRSWAAQSADGTDCSKRVAGIGVYGSMGATDDVLLLVDEMTVELDVVFTGYYQPHTTGLSRRTWSQGRSMRPGRPPRRNGHPRPDYCSLYSACPYDPELRKA
ncbi:hypothetical protein V5799_009103 [Amblyomma americanum]|uniref:2',3'-cyclic-nucleotide 3'-phosphodiesterase n=1 Tax=Amblyomma americanum TaxID=6943 RepID=A0AAQ4FBL4_AMBAM